MNDLIILDFEQRQLSLAAAAERQRAVVLQNAKLIWEVKDPAQQQEAVHAQSDLDGLLRDIEKSREATKAPLLEMGRTLDAQAREFCAPLKKESLRVASLITDFQQLEQAKARAAEEARRAEERRIVEQQRQAELATIRAAEMQRQKLQKEQEELQRQHAQASEREKTILEAQQAEIDRQKALAEAKSHEELDRIQAEASRRQSEIAAQPVIEPARATGQRVVTDWEVTVADVWALARAHPMCVTITPRIGEIKTLLKAGQKVAGVVAKEITISRTTATKAINV
jgi:hypothetical protein